MKKLFLKIVLTLAVFISILTGYVSNAFGNYAYAMPRSFFAHDFNVYIEYHAGLTSLVITAQPDTLVLNKDLLEQRIRKHSEFLNQHCKIEYQDGDILDSFDTVCIDKRIIANDLVDLLDDEKWIVKDDGLFAVLYINVSSFNNGALRKYIINIMNRYAGKKIINISQKERQNIKQRVLKDVIMDISYHALYPAMTGWCLR